MKKILFIVQYPKGISPSQRFRIEIYEEVLKENNFEFETENFIDNDTRKILFNRGFIIKKAWGIMKGFFRRIYSLFKINRYDFIFVQREASPIGPPIFEWIYANVFNKKIIYDFDDSIWVPTISETHNWTKLIKCFWKVESVCKWAYKVSVGNQYLHNFASHFNSNVILNPTCVDTEKAHFILKNQHTNRITIGWTGSFSTLKYLEIVESPLKLLQEKYDFDIKIICNKRPNLNLKNLNYIEWSEENEIFELKSCQIGLMPLTNDEWSEGKCGFKLIQYLSLGIPAVASPIGVNRIIIEEGMNGYFANTELEWFIAIEKLILNADLREKMGKAGREKIVAQYSLQSNETNFLTLFS